MTRKDDPFGLGVCQPRIATRLRPERPNRLARVEKIAEAFGFRCRCGCGPLMPWQRYVVAVGTEYEPDTGLPFYREITGIVPRQSGKSIVELLWMCDRALSWPTPQNCVYTAQTGRAAAVKLIEDWGDQVLGSQSAPVPSSGLSPLVTNIRRAMGSERIDWVTGSRFRLESAKKDAGHGPTVHLAVIDEAFSDADNRREQALIPSMNTIPDAQILVFSTEGDETSAYLARKVANGRAAAEADEGEGVAYFEWSCDPETMDPADPANWPFFMPALGHTISERTVRTAKQSMVEEDGDLSGFFRAYGNIRQRARLEAPVFDEHMWAPVVDPNVAPDGDLVFAVDATPDRSHGSIVACGSNGVVEVVEHGEGAAWLKDRAIELRDRHGGEIVVLGRGAAAGIAANEDRIHRYDVPTYMQACGDFFDAVSEGAVSVRSSDGLYPVLASAVKAGRRRYAGDAWYWDRRDTSDDISPLVAATLAFHRATTAAGGDVIVMYA